MVRFPLQISFTLVLLLSATKFSRSICCNDKDQMALLIFKKGVKDTSNRLSSWSSEQDCCAWPGVQCDSITCRVTSLDLRRHSYNDSESLRGEINLSLLELEFLNYLDLSFNDFESINMPYIHDSPHANLSKLEYLDLSSNYHLRMDNLHWLSPLSSLKYLSLSGIDLQKETNWLQSMTSLSFLSELWLRDCQLTNMGPFVNNVNFSSLETLVLSENHFDSELPNWLFNLSNSLSYLDLSNNSLRGQLPNRLSFRNLHDLNLSYNKFSGSIPNWLGELDFLNYIDLSNNALQGPIPSNFGNLSFEDKSLDISFNDLSGHLPKSFENHFYLLDVSHNLFSGDLTNMMLDSLYIFMSSNNFKGRLPRISAKVVILDLAHNAFSGSLSPFLCRDENEYVNMELKYLDLSNNVLIGELPDCWINYKYLSYLSLGSNKLTGEVPSSMGSLDELESLNLHNNGFFGDIPLSLHHCRKLVLIDMERNNFSGSIPNWMQQSVSVVNLRSNQFTGEIPPQLCQLSNLIVLDLADNKLSGIIPHCLYNITAMVLGFLDKDFIVESSFIGDGTIVNVFKTTLSTKGQQLEYVEHLELVRSIDLSANKLSGEIPPQLFFLTKLQSLNLSYNHLTGKIPTQIGRMKDLESLDFSHNKLHGEIPEGFSSLSFLSDLNLSYNNFNGQIPLGTQLQSFDAWSYIGNPGLCGAPLIKNCIKLEKTKLIDQGNDDSFLKSLYLGMGVGFAMGFWGICGSLFLIRTWRHRFFRLFDRLIDQLYVTMALKFKSFH